MKRLITPCLMISAALIGLPGCHREGAVKAPTDQKPSEPVVAPMPDPMPQGKDNQPGPKESRYTVGVSAAAISPDGKFALLAYDGAVKVSSIAFRIWDIDEAKALAYIPGPDEPVRFCSFLGDERKFVAVYQDGRIIVFGLTGKGDMTRGEQLKTMQTTAKVIRTAQLSANERFLITSSLDGITEVWDLEKQVQLRRLGDEKGVAAAISGDGKYALIAVERELAKNQLEHDLVLWDVGEGKALKKFRTSDGWTYPAGFSRDGKALVLATGKGDLTKVRDLVLFDLPSLKESKVLKEAITSGWTGPVQQQPGTSRWFADLTLPMENSNEFHVIFFDFEKPEKRRTVSGAPVGTKVGLMNFTLSSDGGFAIATTGVNEEQGRRLQVHVWDLSTGRLRTSWRDTTPRPGRTGLTFSLDNTFSCADDRGLRRTRPI
jgi:WD40 repeat protein